MQKLIRVTTVPISLEKLLNGQWDFFGKHYDITAVSSDKERLEKFGSDFKIKTFHVPLTRKITPFQDLKSIWILYKFFKKEEPKIVHSLTPKAGLIAMSAAFLAQVPIRLHDVVGLPLMEKTGFKYYLLFYVEKLVYALSHRIYPNSFGLKRYISNIKLASDKKMKVLANGSSNGLDISTFSKKLFSDKKMNSLKKKLNINTSDFVYLFVGRLVGDKGINELVKAFVMLTKNDLKVKLLLVGFYESDLDPLRSETIKKIEQIGQIITVGYKEDIRPYLAISSCFVFPSYREGFPNVILEAASMELPCIVTDINGSNEIIEDRFNGIIVPKKDTTALRDAMLEIKENEALMKLCIKNSRSSVSEKFGKESFYNSLLSEYKSLEFDL
tara:strand:+ start:7051 stop:8205 length:1155 start_codon:yes stop_codon:yes gene_type:complete